MTVFIKKMAVSQKKKNFFFPTFFECRRFDSDCFLFFVFLYFFSEFSYNFLIIFVFKFHLIFIFCSVILKNNIILFWRNWSDKKAIFHFKCLISTIFHNSVFFFFFLMRFIHLIHLIHLISLLILFFFFKKNNQS